MEDASEHPIGAAVAAGARERFGGLPSVEGFDSAQGLGVSGVVDGRVVVAGRAGWLSSAWGWPVPDGLAPRAAAAETTGRTVVFAGWDGAVRGALVVSDTIKPTSADAVRRLRGLGLSLVLLTGDNERAARSVADAVGIGEVIAGVLPAGKVDAVKMLQDAGRVVAMAGDGINDAPALAAADVGIAMGTGTDVAIESAGITLVKGDLMGIVKAVHLSRAVMRNIRQNLFFAFMYNALGVPIAAGLLYPLFGILLSPMIAGAAMSFSSVTVIANALRLRSIEL